MRIQIKDKNNFLEMFNRLFLGNQIKHINGISIDSRNFKKNDIFIALKGRSHNANEFIDSIYAKSICCFSNQEIKQNKIIFNSSGENTIKNLAKNWRRLSKSKIIGITGSNGKTTTKDLLYHIIKNKFRCSKSEGNYNSMIGLPLSFLSSKVSDEFIILELGANEPNEIKNLCNIVKPEYSLITNISNAHIGNYNSINDIVSNKSAIYSSLPKYGVAFIDADCKYLKNIKLNSNIITFGLKNDADYFGEISFNKNKCSLNINNDEIRVPLHLSHLPKLILSSYVISNYFDISKELFEQSLQTFKLPYGRGQVIEHNGCSIIDDTYNANPSSLKLGINRMNNLSLNKNKKILVIGDMLELGKNAKKEHSRIGKLISKTNVDYLLTYGDLMKSLFNDINNSKIKQNHFNDLNSLSKFLKKISKNGDWIYIKGSRSMQLERLFKL